MSKPRVKTKCVANAYTGGNERIVEFSFPDVPIGSCGHAGGLISFRVCTDKRGRKVPVVNVYRQDKCVKVRVGKGE